MNSSRLRLRALLLANSRASLEGRREFRETISGVAALLQQDCRSRAAQLGGLGRCRNTAFRIKVDINARLIRQSNLDLLGAQGLHPGPCARADDCVTAGRVRLHDTLRSPQLAHQLPPRARGDRDARRRGGARTGKPAGIVRRPHDEHSLGTRFIGPTSMATPGGRTSHYPLLHGAIVLCSALKYGVLSWTEPRSSCGM